MPLQKNLINGSIIVLGRTAQVRYNYKKGAVTFISRALQEKIERLRACPFSPSKT